MNLKIINLTLGAALALGGTLGAQQSMPRWSVSASAGLGTDSLNAITNSGTSWWTFGAYNLDFGYSGMIAGSGVPFRATVGINYLPAGTEGRGTASAIFGTAVEKNTLTGYYIAGDMFFDSRIVDNLKVVLGISVNKWSLEQKNGFDEVLNPNTGIYSLVRAPGKKETYSIAGPKFGGRIGLEYQISDSLAFDVIFQIIEVGQNRSHFLENDDGYTYVTGSKPWNPSWLQFGFKYSF